MALQSINFPPGIQKEGTAYSSEGSWADADKVRFKAGMPERIGGWSKHIAGTLNGVARAVIAWRSNDGTVNTAYGTNKKLYIEQGGTLYDITPLRKTTATMSSDPAASVNASTTVTITDTAHGAATGDFVTLSGLTMGASGLVTTEVNANHELTVLTVDTYTITVATAASATASVGGTAGVAAYEVSIGTITEVFGYGYGTYTWGDSTWGTARTTSSVTLAPRIWSLDTFGEDLIATYEQGLLYTWDASGGSGVRATVITNAPASNSRILISTPDRHLIAFGSHDGTGFDPLLVKWASQESTTDWTASSINTAGSMRISGGSKIVGAKRGQGQVLVWTDTDLHSMQFTGPPYTFGFQQIATECGAAGPNAMVVSNSVAYWIGEHNFYMYDGSVKPLPSTVRTYVFNDINKTQRSKMVAGLNQAFHEVWWFYPAVGSDENNKYVMYNYAEGVWSLGTMGRSAWVDRGTFRLPIGVSDTGVVYDHEKGNTEDGTAMVSYIESAEFDLGEGDELFSLHKIIPDISQDAGSVDISFDAKMYPNDAAKAYGPFTVTPTTEKINTRIRARQISIKFTSDALLDEKWRLGTSRIDIKPAGRR
jgi:hypothetical protein